MQYSRQLITRDELCAMLKQKRTLKGCGDEAASPPHWYELALLELVLAFFLTNMQDVREV